METNIKKQILEILENFKIKREDLASCLALAYDNKSRMPEYITRKKNPFPLKSTVVQQLMWEEYGIPQQIYTSLEKYIEEEEGETLQTNKTTAD